MFFYLSGLDLIQLLIGVHIETRHLVLHNRVRELIHVAHSTVHHWVGLWHLIVHVIGSQVIVTMSVVAVVTVFANAAYFIEKN